MKTITQVINDIVKNPLCIDMAYKTKNTVELSGWVLRKPKIIKHDKTRVESCSLLLYQIVNSHGEIKVESFSCMVYVKDLVDQLKNVDKVLFLACVGKIRHHKEYGDYTQVSEIITLAELDIDVAEEWRKKDEYSKK